MVHEKQESGRAPLRRGHGRAGARPYQRPERVPTNGAAAAMIEEWLMEDG